MDCCPRNRAAQGCWTVNEGPIFFRSDGDGLPFVDKSGVLRALGARSPIVLELGCGGTKQVTGAIGIDQYDHEGVDIVGDVATVVAAFPDRSVDAVHSFHFFEHVEDVKGLLKEIERILRPGGRLEVVVPHFSNPYFYSDVTHRTFFGLYTFDYFTRRTLFSRKVFIYGESLALEVTKIDLVFKSPKPFYGRYAIKRLLGWVFNSCNYMRELYEENFCYLFPCYEIRFLLRRRPDST